MQRRENEMACLRRRNRGRDRFEVAHLAEQDHVGVLTQGSAQRLGEARRVGPDLALVDDATLVTVNELDRVLDREDVLGALAVDLVDQGRQRRRLARPGWPGDQDQTTRLLGQRVQSGGDAELLESLDVGRDQPEGGAERAALEEDIDAEAREARDRMREVDLAVDLEQLLLLRGQDAIEHLVRVLGREVGDVLVPLEGSVHAHSRRRADRDVKV
jgi:hypothetical protein